MMLEMLAMVALSQTYVVTGVGSVGSVVSVLPIGKSSDVIGLVSSDVSSPMWPQRSSLAAQRFTMDLLLGEQVTLVKKKAGPSVSLEGERALTGRVKFGKVWLDEALVEAGLAWVVPEARTNAALVKLEDAARAAKRGLWADEAAVEPWLVVPFAVIGDTRSKLVHSGLDCAETSSCGTACASRFADLRSAADAGFSPHSCFTPAQTRSAQQGGLGDDDRSRTDASGIPQFAVAARRVCRVTADCTSQPMSPTDCGNCSGGYISPVRRDVAARMKTNYSRLKPNPIPCPACVDSPPGGFAVCRNQQCAVSDQVNEIK